MAVPSVDGLVRALAFLLSLALSARRARQAGLAPQLAVETHVLAVGTALAAALLPGLARHGGRGLRRALAETGGAAGVTAALLALALVAGAMAWASARPVAFLAAIAPGAVLVGTAFAGTWSDPGAGEAIAAGLGLAGAWAASVASSRAPARAVLLAGFVLAALAWLVPRPLPPAAEAASLAGVALVLLLGARPV